MAVVSDLAASPHRTTIGRQNGQGNKEDASVVKISIDAMGGDIGPEVCIEGAAIALDREPDIQYIIFGQ